MYFRVIMLKIGNMKFENTPHLNINKKSLETRQAQAEIFADQKIKNFSDDQRIILKYSTELAEIEDLNNPPSHLPKELTDLIRENKDAYLDFLRQEKRLTTSFAQENIKIYKEVFRPAISALREKISQEDFSALPEYLGSGSNGSAFRIKAEGKEYAAKFSKCLTQANFEIKPLLRAKDIPNTAQLVSYSLPDGVVIMELIEGENVTNRPPDEKPEYSDEHIIGLIETVHKLDAIGLVIDPKPSNFIYSPDQGFSILDYHLKGVGENYGLPEEIIDLRFALSARKWESINNNDPNYEERQKEQSLEKNKTHLSTMVRLLSILKNHYPEIIEDWKIRQEKKRSGGRIFIPELIKRENLPNDRQIDKYLDQLAELGF